MANFDIPKEDLDAIKLYCSLPPTLQNGILNIFKTVGKGVKPKTVAETISSTLEIPLPQSKNITTVFIALTNTRLVYKYTTEELIDNIVNALLGTGEFDQKDVAAFAKPLQLLMEVENLNSIITAKAYDLGTDYEKIYLEASVYNDIRPIFINEEISANALFHTLRLKFRNKFGAKEEFYLALDNDDLNELILVLNTAKKRIQAIKEHFGDQIIEIEH